MDKIKPFTTATTTSTTTKTDNSTTTTTSDVGEQTAVVDNQDLDQFLDQLSVTGELSDLINMTSRLQLPASTTLLNIRQQLTMCPIHTFVAEVSKVYQAEMDHFGQKLLPSVRHLQIAIPAKVSLTMILACICVRSWSTSTPVMQVAETLKQQPSHLKPVQLTGPPPVPDQRFYVGGDCLSSADLGTLDSNEWLNDKVINAYLGVLKEERNLTDSHIFVLPSYTAVLWEGSNFNHWMFKKVQFSVYQYIMMLINVNGNHWCLMVVSMMDKTVAILDSMHGTNSQKYAEYWRNFVACRNMVADIGETMSGAWLSIPNASNKQQDGSSCGIFTLMNAECLALGIPVHVMRQVHAAMYRQYVKQRLLGASTTTIRKCHMLDCKETSKDVTHCGVCGRWFHRKCSNTAHDSECVICTAMYK